MKKIPTVFERDWDSRDKHVIDQVNPAAAWLFEGVPYRVSRKVDGTCVMFDGGNWWARREVKVGKEIPAGYQAIDVDSETKKIMGYEPIEQSSFRKYFLEALEKYPSPLPGTYELCGPKINGNPEKLDAHQLFYHAAQEVDISIGDRFNYEYLQILLTNLHLGGWEGLVFKERLDTEIGFNLGEPRMAKLKYRDFPKENA